MFHEVTVPRRDFDRLTCSVFLSVGFGPVDVMKALPLMSTGIKPVAFDVSVVVPFTYVMMKWLALSWRVYTRISYEVLSNLATLPLTSAVSFTFALAFADARRRRFTLSGNGLKVALPLGVRTGVMFDVQSLATSLAGSL